MQDRISNAFKRYFNLPGTAPNDMSLENAWNSLGSVFNPGNLFSGTVARSAAIAAFKGANKWRTFGVRATVSEIIPNRVYLSNLPKTLPFEELVKEAKDADGEVGLLVSCLEMREIAKSEANLLLEPEAKKIKYHILAMQDVTANVDTDDLIYDALNLMYSFSQRKVPVRIHCFSGIGRSAMITAVHLCHLYLRDDAEIKALFDKDAPLDAKSETFVTDLYKRATDYVYSKRSCCEFDSDDRNGCALRILDNLRQQIPLGEQIPLRNQSYDFMVDFVQSPEYKKLIQQYYNSTSFLPSIPQANEPVIEYKKILEQFLTSFRLNEAGWYEQLVTAVSEAKTTADERMLLNPLTRASHASAVAEMYATDRKTLLEGLLFRVDQLAERYKEALHSQPVLKYKQQQQCEIVASGLSEIQLADAEPPRAPSPFR